MCDPLKSALRRFTRLHKERQSFRGPGRATPHNLGSAQTRQHCSTSLRNERSIIRAYRRAILRIGLLQANRLGHPAGAGEDPWRGIVASANIVFKALLRQKCINSGAYTMPRVFVARPSP